MPTDTPPPPTFEAQLAVFPEGKRITGASSCGGRFGGLDPDDYAADLLTTHEWSGLWLLAYMTARFGFPNKGSDPDKNLCSWALTTPLENCWLVVTPYMGQDGSRKLTERDLAKDNIYRGGNALQFGYAMTEEMNMRLHPVTPAEQTYWEACEAVVADWWKTTGHLRFAFIACTEKETRQHTRVWKWGPHTKLQDHTWGLYVRTPELEAGMLDESGNLSSAKKTAEILAQPLHRQIVSGLAEALAWRLRLTAEALRVPLHGPVEGESPLFTLEGLGIDPAKWPILDRKQMDREGAAWDAEHLEPMRRALRATLKDLLRPVWVRDVAFNALGRCFEGGYPFSACQQAQTVPENISSAPRFAGAGWLAKAWYEKVEKQTQEEKNCPSQICTAPPA